MYQQLGTAPERSWTDEATIAPKIGGKLDRGVLHTVGVAGSIPAAPTIFSAVFRPQRVVTAGTMYHPTTSCVTSRK
jgi:hypothetical protein